MTRAIVAILLMVLITPGCAGRIGPSGLEGHPIERLPLTVLIDRLDDDVERAVYRAVEDWNTVFRETVGVPAFVVGPSTRGAHVVISPVNVFYAPATARIATGRPSFAGPAVESVFYAWASGLIRLPVRINVRQIAAFDEVSRETFFYRALTRELGRALGVPDVDSPHSARRRLAEHYRQFWGAQPV
jgi:hypothetical protein